MILYLYKVMIGLAPNPGFERIPYNERTGLKFEVKRSRGAAKWVQDLRNASFFSVAPTIFNQLPFELRNFAIPEVPSKKNVEKYKEGLDEYLWNVPDQPDIPGVQNRRAAESNSLVHQIRYYTPPPNRPRPVHQTNQTSSTGNGRNSRHRSCLANSTGKNFHSRWDMRDMESTQID